MELSDITLVKTIIETGSLSEASQRLHQSQPTLSRKLSRLEKQLGATLFHRSPKGLVATPMGIFIAESTQSIDHQVNRIRRHVQQVTQLETGTLHIGVGPIIEMVMLPELLSRLWRDTGEIQITVISGDDEKLARAFERAEVDVMIGPFPASEWEARGMMAVSMISDAIVPVARADHPLFRAGDVSAETIQTYPIAVPKTGTAEDEHIAPFTAPPKLRVDNYHLLKQVCLETDAICAGPRAIFREEIIDGSLRVISVDLDARWRSTLIVRPETLESPLVARLVKLSEEVARDLRKQ
ncbi:MAG: LysR family transcriptional regulator [Pseudomonadota bacterium]